MTDEITVYRKPQWSDETYNAVLRMAAKLAANHLKQGENDMTDTERDALREANMNLKAENDRLRAAMAGARDEVFVMAAAACQVVLNDARTNNCGAQAMGAAWCRNAINNLSLRTPDATTKETE